MNTRSRFGAGAVILCGRSILLQQRAECEHEPLTWCVFGGMAEPGEFDPKAVMFREVMEEAGIDLESHPVTLLYQFEDRSHTFRFFNYLAVLPDKVVPTISVETHRAEWFDLGDSPETLWRLLPRPLHSGMIDLVRNWTVTRMVHDCAGAGRHEYARQA